MERKQLSPLGNDPEMVKLLASDIYKIQLDGARKKVADTTFDLEEMKRVMEVAIAESDRAAAIVLFSYAEDRMLDGIKLHINDNIKGGFAALTSPSGLLATAHDRITFLAALRWINKPTYSALHLLRNIRNEFAHRVACDSFSDNTIAGMVTSLPDFGRAVLKRLEISNLSHRETYLVRAILTVYNLMQELCTYPHAIHHHVNPRDIVVQDDGGPGNLRELSGTVVDSILTVLRVHLERSKIKVT